MTSTLRRNGLRGDCKPPDQPGGLGPRRDCGGGLAAARGAARAAAGGRAVPRRGAARAAAEGPQARGPRVLCGRGQAGSRPGLGRGRGLRQQGSGMIGCGQTIAPLRHRRQLARPVAGPRAHWAAARSGRDAPRQRQRPARPGAGAASRTPAGPLQPGVPSTAPVDRLAAAWPGPRRSPGPAVGREAELVTAPDDRRGSGSAGSRRPAARTPRVAQRARAWTGLVIVRITNSPGRGAPGPAGGVGTRRRGRRRDRRRGRRRGLDRSAGVHRLSRPDWDEPTGSARSVTLVTSGRARRTARRWRPARPRRRPPAPATRPRGPARAGRAGAGRAEPQG